MSSIDSPVVLITGGLSDIGRATAQAFAQAGYAIVVNYRHHAEPAVAFAAALKQQWHAPEALALSADVRSRAEVQALYKEIDRTLGRVDVLVNNAGLNRDQPLLDMTDDNWDTVIATILTGTFMCSQEFARQYTGIAGNIINLGAVTAIKGRKNGANYCSARAGILTLTKCLALELAPRIRVNVVTPGRIDTAELQTRYRLDDERNRQRLEQDIPLQHLGQPADVAAMIVFLVTAGQYITGQNFFVDGGLFMH